MPSHLFPWQVSDWQKLQSLRERLPHAILLHGPEGIGKTNFAERFAQSLLCQAPLADGQACDACDSCGWFVQYSHPDYRRVRPEALDEEAEQEGGDAEEEGEKKSGKAAKAPSKEIKIAQIRALADFVNISTHRQGLRIILLYPAETLNSMAANALLKTLEEPPPNTLFLLVSHGIDRLLPTILSRCRKIALSTPAREAALAWLEQAGVPDAESSLAEQGGAPLLAQAFAAQGGPEVLQELLQALSRPSADQALKTADRMQKIPVPDVVSWLQRWTYDLLASKLSGRIRYYPRYHKEIFSLATMASTDGLLELTQRFKDRRAIAEHPLSAKLFLEDTLLEYASAFSSR
ncbi:DNA polymerase III, delta prime subunit [Noviherbaspirillum humi]|uniref:DNA polymerase III, delta prime subunit n=1 Tax=Noviherbaspirillum humi TaxID=1688639 RepID=A0A239HB11_9BURK|nr:DNA polymerase III subunit delta' [Noviherbaspirillum humi]SNS78550.1 DNA polymerase III, delta prime subunit [Noviherbaspirillum humi]